MERNSEPLTFPRSGEQWHTLFDCGHKVNFGGGAKPGMSEYRCASCPRENSESK